MARQIGFDGRNEIKKGLHFFFESILLLLLLNRYNKEVAQVLLHKNTLASKYVSEISNPEQRTNSLCGRSLSASDERAFRRAYEMALEEGGGSLGSESFQLNNSEAVEYRDAFAASLRAAGEFVKLTFGEGSGASGTSGEGGGNASDVSAMVAAAVDMAQQNALELIGMMDPRHVPL